MDQHEVELLRKVLEGARMHRITPAEMLARSIEILESRAARFKGRPVGKAAQVRAAEFRRLRAAVPSLQG